VRHQVIGDRLQDRVGVERERLLGPVQALYRYFMGSV
jgi:hypothetical protein